MFEAVFYIYNYNAIIQKAQETAVVMINMCLLKNKQQFLFSSCYYVFFFPIIVLMNFKGLIPIELH